MIAVIAGATGLVGSVLIQKLLHDPRFSQVKSVSRKSLNISSPKLKEIICPNFDELESKAEALGGDIYYCCLGTTIKTAGTQAKFRKVDYDAVMAFAEIANGHDAKSFVLVSAQGANPDSRIFYSKVKGEVEESLKSLGLKHLIIMRPSLLMGERHEYRRGEKAMITALNYVGHLLPGKLKKRAMTRVETLASRMLEAGIQSSSSLNVINATEI